MLSKKRLILCLKIFITTLILWMLVRQSQLQLELMNTLLANFFLSITVIIFCFMTVFINAARWYRLSRVQHLHLPAYQTFLASYLGMAFNNVLPGSVGGDFFRLFYIFKRFPHSKSGALLSILLDRVCGLMGILVMACLIALCYLKTFDTSHPLFYLLASCLAVGIIAISLFFVSIFFLPTIKFFSYWVATFQSKWTKPWHAFFESMYLYRNSKLIVIESVGLSILSQCMLLGGVLLINKMMGLEPLPWSDFMLALEISQIANLLPLTPGGLGVGEAMFANILYILHPGATVAYATVFFALRVLSLLAYLPGVLIGVFSTGLFKERIMKA